MLTDDDKRLTDEHVDHDDYYDHGNHCDRDDHVNHCDHDDHDNHGDLGDNGADGNCDVTMVMRTQTLL